jgi:hypothetical protein
VARKLHTPDKEPLRVRVVQIFDSEEGTMRPYKNPLLSPVALIAFLAFSPFTPLHSEEGVQVSGYFFGDVYGSISHQNPEVTGRFCLIHCVCFFGVRFEMGLLTGGFSLGDRLPPGRDETMALIQEVTDGDQRKRDFFAS